MALSAQRLTQWSAWLLVHLLVHVMAVSTGDGTLVSTADGTAVIGTGLGRSAGTGTGTAVVWLSALSLLCRLWHGGRHSGQHGWQKGCQHSY